MAGDFSLDHVDNSPDFNLDTLFLGDSEHQEEGDQSQFKLIDTSCSYYEPNEVTDILSDTNNDLSIFYLNAQGLKAHWDSICNLLNEMGTSSYAFDKIGITELFNMTSGEYSLPGYHAIEYIKRNDSNSPRGGIGMYVKEKFQFKVLTDLSIFIKTYF